MSIADNLNTIKKSIPKQVTLVAVSKTKPIEDLQEAYNAGQRIFGENKIQELREKHPALPKDIQWHMIGHLQSNKVKYIAPFVELIHGVDSIKLLTEINKQAEKNSRVINCLLQIKIAKEDSKFGLSKESLFDLINSEDFKNLKSINVKGVMGMASFIEDEEEIKSEFNFLKSTFKDLKTILPHIDTISMGMSGDYNLAINCGSTMIRVGSSIFGQRNYSI